MALVKLQLGKKGLTQEFLENLKLLFEKQKDASIRISILKSASRDKTQVKQWIQDILAYLGDNYKANLIGYTIVMRKLRKNKD